MKVLFLSLVACSVLFASSISLSSEYNSEKKIAISNIKKILKEVSPEERVRLGFSKSVNIDALTLASPYSVQIFSKEFNESKNIVAQKPFDQNSELRFPVIEDGKYVALVSVFKYEGKYIFGDLGAIILSRELERVEKSQKSINKSSSKILVRHLIHKSDLVVYNSKNLVNADFIPLKSFKNYQIRSRKNLKPTDAKMTLGQIHRLTK